MSDADSFVGLDIEMWDIGDRADAKVSRPCRLRINGVEIPIIEGSEPYMHIGDIGGKKHPLVVDINGLVVRSLKISPGDPSA